MPEVLLKCPHCRSERIKTIWRDTHWDRCDSCLLYFRNPMPTHAELEQLYRQSWISPEHARSETGGTELQLARVYAKKLMTALNLPSLSGLRILDFGAGRGAMLSALREAGATVYAVDPFAFEYLRARGFEAYPELHDVPGQLDGVVSIDVIEHLREPWRTLQELCLRLNHSGWLFVATGNPVGLNALLAGARWREAMKPGHLVFPHPTTLFAMLKNIGCMDIKRLKWFVRYPVPPVRALIHRLLQLSGLEGELRYLARK